VTPKFEELNIESKQDENAFFKVEIVEFAKGMGGWGNLAVYAISLFVENLCEKCELTEATRIALVREVETYFSGQKQQSIATGKKSQKQITLSSTTQRRTMALSHAQVQEALQNPPEFVTWDVASDDIAKVKRERGEPAPSRSSKTKDRGSARGSDKKPVEIPAFAGSRASPRTNSSSNPKATPTKKASTEDFQLSRRKMAAKTVTLTSNGFLANLNSSAYI